VYALRDEAVAVVESALKINLACAALVALIGCLWLPGGVGRVSLGVYLLFLGLGMLAVAGVSMNVGEVTPIKTPDVIPLPPRPSGVVETWKGWEAIRAATQRLTTSFQYQGFAARLLEGLERRETMLQALAGWVSPGWLLVGGPFLALAGAGILSRPDKAEQRQAA
jgi:hypothetical protein